MLRQAVTASLMLISFAVLSRAQDKPNYSGTWKLNTAKSDFGVIPGPESQTNVIEHNEPSMKIASNVVGPQGKMEANISYTTDGKEALNTVAGREIKSNAAWDGPNLVVNAKLSFNDQDVAIKYTWKLSTDGKTLNQSVHYNSPMGETDQTLVFEKQEAGAVTAQAPEPAKPAEPAKAIATTAPAGSKPNLSGVWKLDPAKSDFGVMPAPDMRTDTIDHSDPVLKIARKENGPDGAREFVLNMSTDGKEVNNDLGQAQAKITASWEGASLVVNTKLKIQDQDIAIRQVSTLSEDGKTLTSKSHMTTAMGELDQTEVYSKQP